MKREELERVGYIVFNTSNTYKNAYIKNYIYKLKGFNGNNPNDLWVNTELDSNNSTTNGIHSKWFRLATPQEIEMYKQAGKPVDVTTYKMKVPRYVECVNLREYIGVPTGIERGKIYELYNKEYCSCGILNYLLRGVPKLNKTCFCGKEVSNTSYRADRFKPSTKEAFERQNNTSDGSLKYKPTALKNIINIGNSNKIVELPIRKKSKRKVKMEILESPQIIEL
jgi:hypothetical protein